METPPSYYRQPPDGHEFPDYEETTTTVVAKTELPLISSLRCCDVGAFPRNCESTYDAFSDNVSISAIKRTRVKPPKVTEHKCVEDAVPKAAASKSIMSTDSFKRFESSDVPQHTLFDKSKNTSNKNTYLDLTKSNKELFLSAKTDISQKITEPKLISHNRSQSCGDISENYEKRSTDKWRMIVEQRKRGLSKLKGLVIPESSNESGLTASAAVDIPEIKTNDTISIAGIADIVAVTPERPVSHSCSSSIDCPKTVLLPTTCSIPKYSPAFKRKGLQIYGGTNTYSTESRDTNLKKTSEIVGTSKLQNTLLTPHELTVKIAKTDNKNSEYREPRILSLGDPPKSLESITSPTRSDCSFEYINNSPENKSFSNQDMRSKEINRFDKQNMNRSEDESDNDSAVSSSQSSISQNSPPASPDCFYFGTAMCNMLKADPAMRQRGTGFDRESQIFNRYEDMNHRLLKPHSIEAINRKNILASAKCRSGRDLNITSPFIERKFNEEENQTSKQTIRTSSSKPETSDIAPKKNSTAKQPTSCLRAAKKECVTSKLPLILNQTLKDVKLNNVIKNVDEKPKSVQAHKEDLETHTKSTNNNNNSVKKAVLGQSTIVKENGYLSKNIKTTSVKDLRKSFENIGAEAVVQNILKFNTAKKAPVGHVNDSKLNGTSKPSRVKENVPCKEVTKQYKMHAWLMIIVFFLLFRKAMK